MMTKITVTEQPHVDGPYAPSAFEVACRAVHAYVGLKQTYEALERDGALGPTGRGHMLRAIELLRCDAASKKAALDGSRGV